MPVISSALKQSRLRRDAHARFHEVIEFCRRHLRRMFDPYRPEFHYMRGPGPKWQEKHASKPADVNKIAGE